MLFDALTGIGGLTLTLILFLLLVRPLWVLSANALLEHFPDQRTRTWPVDAAKHIYRNALIGKHVATGYARPFVVCDEFIGISYAEADNTLGAAGAIDCEIETEGDWVISLTGVTIADVGRAVFATADNTIALTGHALAYMGRIIGVAAANYAIVRLKDEGELPTHADAGTQLTTFGPWTKATGNNGAAAEHIDGDGVLVGSALGLGVIPKYHGSQLSLDDTDEASDAGLVTVAKYLPTKGIVARFKIAAYSTTGVAMTGANVDLDFGLANAVVRTALDPSHHVHFHVDGAGTTLELGGDDDTHDVAEADTSLELPLTLALADEYTIIIRVDGSVEVYNGATLIAAPVLTTLDFSAVTTLLAGFVNVEKTSAAGIAIVEVCDFQVFGGR